MAKLNDLIYYFTAAMLVPEDTRRRKLKGTNATSGV